MTRIADPQINFADLEFLAQGVELDPLLNRISEFLNDQPTIIEWVRQDLQRGLAKPSTGRLGMTAAQVLHSADLNARKKLGLSGTLRTNRRRIHIAPIHRFLQQARTKA